MKLPNFFIIGAPKCGTTSMASWLAEHPQIYFSPAKEPFHFSADILQKYTSWADYQNLFKYAEDSHLAVGEGSTIYLFSQVAVEKIEATFDKPKYIVMLRNPIDMAYSLHEQQYYCLNENIPDFGEAWRLSPERRSGRMVPPGCKSQILLDYQRFCMLGEQLERLFARVPRDRVHVIFLDDIKQNTRKEYQNVLGFLGLEDDGRSDFPVYNQAKKWRSSWQGRLVRSLSESISWLKIKKRILPKQSFGFIDYLRRRSLDVQKRQPLDDPLRDELRDFYYEDVKKLGKIINRDLLSLWKL